MARRAPPARRVSGVRPTAARGGPDPAPLAASDLTAPVEKARAAALPALVAAAASPVVAFYGAGYLLALGYFLDMGPALMTAFSPSELALVGFARLASDVAVGAFLAFFLVTAAYLLAAVTPEPRTARRADLFAAAVCVAAGAAIVATSLRAGFLTVLLGVVAATMTLVFAVAFLLGREDWLQRRGHPWRWLLPGLMLVLGLPALGEAGFREANQDTRAQWITVPVSGRPVRARLLMLGAAAMIYETGGRRYLSGPRGESPLEIGWPGQGSAETQARRPRHARL